MNFKKFMVSLAVSTMLVGSQAAVSNAVKEEGSKQIVNAPKTGKEKRSGFVTWAPATFGGYNLFANIFNLLTYSFNVDVELPNVLLQNGEGYHRHISTFILDLLLIGYSFAIA